MSRPVKVHLAAALLIASCAVASARTAQIDNKLNLRQGPGSEHRVLFVMPAGANVTVGECRGEWCKVEFRGQRGYANSALLSGGDAALAAAPVAAPAAASTKYEANDEVRVLNWNDREWRDRYWREMNLRKPRQ
ncbi:MAG: SH3 domain-containing protein [Xanthobacteraceae bacterium]